MAVFKLTLTLDTSNEDYKKYKEMLPDYEELMRTKISSIVSKYTETEAVNNKSQFLKKSKKFFGKCITILHLFTVLDLVIS